MKKGVSFVELMVAIVLLVMILGPLLALLSSTNKTANVSMYEILAFQYASELGEQIQRLSPFLKELSFGTKVSLDQILANPQLVQALSPDPPVSGPSIIPLIKSGGANVTLAVSGLHPAFVSRRLCARKLQNQDPRLKILNAEVGEFWDLTVSLQWKLAPQEAIVHGASFSYIIREAP